MTSMLLSAPPPWAELRIFSRTGLLPRLASTCERLALGTLAGQWNSAPLVVLEAAVAASLDGEAEAFVGVEPLQRALSRVLSPAGTIIEIRARIPVWCDCLPFDVRLGSSYPGACCQNFAGAVTCNEFRLQRAALASARAGNGLRRHGQAGIRA
jgi:hypothetical protein